MTFNERLLNLVGELTQRKESLTAELAITETRISKLTLLAEGAIDDPELEGLVLRLLPPPPEPPKQEFISIPVTPPAPVVPPIPRVKITAEKVLQLTQSFVHPFQLKHAVSLLCEREHVTDEGETKRIRAALYSMMCKLIESGKLMKAQQGIGRTPALFQRVPNRMMPAYRGSVPDDINVNIPLSHAASNGQ